MTHVNFLLDYQTPSCKFPVAQLCNFCSTGFDAVKPSFTYLCVSLRAGVSLWVSVQLPVGELQHPDQKAGSTAPFSQQPAVEETQVQKTS